MSLGKHQTRIAVVGLLGLILAVVFSSPNYPLATASGSVTSYPRETPSGSVTSYPRETPSGSVETIQFRSALIGKTLPYSVVLPSDYRASRTTRYPVLYLLHGLGGHYSDWLTKTNVADYASKYRLIVVTPEGNDGWYADSATIPTDKYESYFMKELMPDVQKRFRTIETRYGRAVAGLSMGGYGALKFALKSPATFIFAASTSGALDAPSWTEDELKKLGTIRDSVDAVFGPVGSETRKANDIFEIVRGVTTARVPGLPFLYLDCGTDDILCTASPRFAALLREKKIAHEFASYREITTGPIGISRCRRC